MLSHPVLHLNEPHATNAQVKARAKAAVLGALVADAATCPLHWICERRGSIALRAPVLRLAQAMPACCKFSGSRT
jgi:hypothetical protein